MWLPGESRHHYQMSLGGEGRYHHQMSLRWVFWMGAPWTEWQTPVKTLSSRNFVGERRLHCTTLGGKGDIKWKSNESICRTQLVNIIFNRQLASNSLSRQVDCTMQWMSIECTEIHCQQTHTEYCTFNLWVWWVRLMFNDGREIR